MRRVRGDSLPRIPNPLTPDPLPNGEREYSVPATPTKPVTSAQSAPYEKHAAKQDDGVEDRRMHMHRHALDKCFGKECAGQRDQAN